MHAAGVDSVNRVVSGSGNVLWYGCSFMCLYISLLQPREQCAVEECLRRTTFIKKQVCHHLCAVGGLYPWGGGLRGEHESFVEFVAATR